MMNGGIDQQIQQRITASGGNPQRLMQSYNQKKELLDLLALQKLKSDKEAAMRNMQMQMQQNPQTVKQQREAELMQMTKDELAAQVGKTMQQQQIKSQNNLKRVANQGIATAPAPNMAQMARGGIVGFAGPQGSQVQGAQGRLTPMLRRPSTGSIYDSLDAEAIGELTEKELKELGITSRASFEALPERTKKELLQKINDRRALARAGTEVGNLPAAAYDTIVGLPAAALENTTEAIRTSRLGRVLGLSEPGEEPEYVGSSPAQARLNQTRGENMPVSEDTLLSQLESPDAQIAAGATPTMRGPTAAQVRQNQRPPVPTEDETDYLDDGVTTVPIGESEGVARLEERVADQTEQPSGIASIVAPVVPSTKREDIVQSTGQRPADDAFRTSMRDAVTSQIGRDPLAEAQAMRDEAAKYKMFSPEERAGLEGIIAERKALEERRMDPKRLAKERLQSFLLGAQGSNLGSTFRTAGLARESARGRQETAEAQLMQARQQKIEDLINKSRDIRSDVFEAGKPAFEAGEKARTSGITAGTGMSDTDLAAQAKAEATASAERRDFATITSNENIASAKIKSQTEIADAQNETQREANRLRAETNQLIATEANQTKLEGQLSRAQDVEQKIQANIADDLKSDIGLQQLQIEFSTALEEGDAKRAQQLQDAMDIIKQKVYGKYKNQLDDIAQQKARINERIDALQFQVIR